MFKYFFILLILQSNLFTRLLLINKNCVFFKLFLKLYITYDRIRRRMISEINYISLRYIIYEYNNIMISITLC